MELVLSKSKLRPWNDNDAFSLAKHANNKKIADNMRDGFPFPYTIDDAQRWLNMAMKETRHVLLAIEVNGEAAGGIGIIFKENVYRLSAEIGYWLGETHWRKGIMSEAIAGLSDYAFAKTEIVRLQAEIFSPNIASMKTILKAGFHLEAINKKAVFKNGGLLDQHVYARIKE
ncbi:MAG: GNAT family protein [Bacteroidetes bacterium]|nr:GNAT family protein [Bacteroidota bacterium]